MIRALKKLFLISRPISWPNTAFPFAAGYLISGGSVDTLFIVATFYFLIPYNLLMYGINDVFDYESDMQNPRKGGIEGAREQKAFHPVIIWAAVTSNIPFVCYMLLAGTYVSGAILLLTIFFVIAYSVAKLRFKEIPILDSATSSIHFVGPLIFALSLFGFSIEQLPYVLAFFLWGMASHAFGAIQDIIPDREGKISSIATVFGARRTVWFVFILYAISTVLIASQGVPGLVVGCTGILYMINVLPYLSIDDTTSSRVNTAWRRFIWLNLFTGFVITMTLIYVSV
ncbi:TPA: prenyltransferase [Candidatus Saccharibacteria bacterium]|nr:MAG: 4-hydroxybenzoate polyprenyltransferase-like protein prenyltransferase [Candidatus Saccharibacteria bacterium GW2011_GWC2_44_17]OGL33734.1 MAG: prenyltransferase [Candidatus Saccharibacteria bacterium RIFCSPHIGHO2_12_FULL_47_16]HBH77900.1 prenyltransferase [Candidatus Saccharibacteria bacterium]